MRALLECFSLPPLVPDLQQTSPPPHLSQNNLPQGEEILLEALLMRPAHEPIIGTAVESCNIPLVKLSM